MKEMRRTGRPPGPHDATLRKLLPTALDLFLTEGGAALTPTRLHQETGVSRATIYRNWPEPADLIEVMLRFATELPEDSDATDDLAADLTRAMRNLLLRFEHRPARAFFGACLEYGRRNERMAAVADDFVVGILLPFRLAIEAALERGDLQGDIDELVAEVTGPVMLRHVILGEDLPASAGQAIVDRFVAAHG